MAKKEEHKKTNRKLRFVLSCVLSFLLSMFLTVGTILLAVRVGFLSKNSVISGMNKNDYYTSAEDSFYQSAKDFTIPIGLPVTVVDDIVDSEKVYDDITRYVSAAVENRAFTFDTDDLESRLTKNVYAYFEQEHLEMNEEQVQTLPEYTRLIADIYREEIEVNYVTLLGKVNTKYGGLLLIGAVICFAISAVIVFMLIRMYHWKHRAMRFVTYSAITTVVMVALPVAVIAILHTTMKPNISPEYLYHALVNYFASALKVFIYFAAGWVAVVAALLLGIRYMKKNS